MFVNILTPCLRPCSYKCLLFLLIVDLATIDPTSDDTERKSTMMVSSLVEAYQSNVKEITSSQDSQEPGTSKDQEQWPVLAMFKNLANLPGPLRQFWILYR